MVAFRRTIGRRISHIVTLVMLVLAALPDYGIVKQKE